MTATPAHTRETLEAMPARELDAVVAEVVFGQSVPEGFTKADLEWIQHCEGHDYPESRAHYQWTETWPTHYSTTWDGFGAIFLRLRELNLGLSMGGHPAEIPNVQAYNHNYHIFIPHRSLRVSAPELPRAAAIAAVILVQAVQGAGV